MILADRLRRLSAGPSLSLGDDLAARLGACLPAALRRQLGRRHRCLVIEPLGHRARVAWQSGEDREALGELDLSAAEPETALLPKPEKGRQYSTELHLPAAAVLRRTVAFPPQVRANLAQVLKYELDRLTPFEADEVVFDYSLLSGQRRGDRISLDLAICRRDLLDGWLRRLTELGSPIERVTWDGAWPRANLLPAVERPKRKQLRINADLVMSILVLMLVTAVMITPVYQKTERLGTIERQLKDARSQAIGVDALRQELERAREGSTAVLQAKLDEPPILPMLLQLTDALPDNTWIQNLEFDRGEVDLRGESEQSTALIALLEQTPGFDGVSFKSPVTQIARTGKERFNISLRYTARRDQ